MKKVKLYLGIFLFVLACVVPLFGFWVATLNLPLALKGTIIGLLTVGGPEVLALLAVAILGKEAFDLIADKAKSYLAKLMPHGSVGKTRYKIGLVLFLLPIVPTYVQGYMPVFLPDASPARLYVNMCADLMFITSLFVLGGDFWDKLRALFIYDAKAHFNQPNSTQA